MAGNKSSAFDNDLLKLIFNNTAISGIADAATTGSLANLFVALHTGDPGAGGTQSTNEVTTTAYPGYARKSVARTTGGWTVAGTGNSVSPAANIVFATPTGSPTAVLTHFSVGVATSGATKILYSGPLSGSITVAAGTPPTLLTTTAITES